MFPPKAPLTPEQLLAINRIHEAATMFERALANNLPPSPELNDSRSMLCKMVAEIDMAIERQPKVLLTPEIFDVALQLIYRWDRTVARVYMCLDHVMDVCKSDLFDRQRQREALVQGIQGTLSGVQVRTPSKRKSIPQGHLVLIEGDTDADLSPEWDWSMDNPEVRARTYKFGYGIRTERLPIENRFGFG